jgi:hypothetical protein
MMVLLLSNFGFWNGTEKAAHAFQRERLGGG